MTTQGRNKKYMQHFVYKSSGKETTLATKHTEKGLEKLLFLLAKTKFNFPKTCIKEDLSVTNAILNSIISNLIDTVFLQFIPVNRLFSEVNFNYFNSLLTKGKYYKYIACVKTFLLGL